MTLAKVLIQITENMVTTEIEEYIGDIPNPKLKDSQAKLVFSAEDECFFWNNLTPLSNEEIVLLVNRISKWFCVNSPKISFEGHTYNSAYATSNLIVLPFPISKSVPYICHEISHVINYQIGPADHHGKYFTTTYLEVVKKVLGVSAFRELKNSFDRFGVKYNQ